MDQEVESSDRWISKIEELLTLSVEFWQLTNTYREQPSVKLTYQVMSVLEGTVGDSQQYLSLVQTTLPERIQRMLAPNTRAAHIKVRRS